MYDDYLAHHGIKGQSWGVQHGPPYPVVRGAGGAPKKTSIVKSKLSEAMKNRADAQAKKKQAKAEALERAKQRKLDKDADKKVEAQDRLRRQIVKHPKDLYKHKNDFSRQEIEEIIKEIEFDRKIQDVRIAEIQRGMASYKRVQETALTTYQFANSLKGIYNIMADVHNAMDDSDKKWPKLGSDEKTDKQKSNKGDSSSGQSSAPAAKSSPAPSQKSSSKGSSKSAAKTVDYAKELEGFQRDALKIDPPKSGSVLDVPFDELFRGL